MSWHYTCNHKKFIDKTALLQEYNASKQAIEFHIPKAYDNYDFSVPPQEPLEELCKQKNSKSHTKPHSVFVLDVWPVLVISILVFS